MITSEIIYKLYFCDGLPEKKQVSSPNLGLYDAHFGAVNSTMAVNSEMIKGKPYDSTMRILHLLELDG